MVYRMVVVDDGGSYTIELFLDTKKSFTLGVLLVVDNDILMGQVLLFLTLFFKSQNWISITKQKTTTTTTNKKREQK